MTVAAWVYLLRCRDGSLYCGWTADLDRRLRDHANGRGSRYTRSRLPVELALAVPMPDASAARREEARIKGLPVAAKRALVAAAQRPTSAGGGAPTSAGSGPGAARAPARAARTASTVNTASATHTSAKPASRDAGIGSA